MNWILQKNALFFIGWAENVNAELRIDTITKFMKDKYPSFRYLDVGCFYTGPYNNRKLSNVAWVEFVSVDTAQNFSKKVSETSNQFEHGGKQILVKVARTELQKTRNFALKDALKLIKAIPESSGKNVEIIWKVPDSKSRHVEVDEEVAFVQTKDDAKGFVSTPFTGLVAPTGLKGTAYENESISN